MATRLEKQETPAALAESTHPRAAQHWRGRLLAWASFLTAAAIGLVFHEPIMRSFSRLLSPPALQREVLYWVSPHDSTFRSDKPGKDSMGMELVPVYAGEHAPKAPVTIEPVLQEREYTTARVESGPLVRTIRTVSTVTYAEPLIGDITLKVGGWLEKLHVDYEGKLVRKGDPLFDVYAAELVATQQELLIGLQAVEAARKQGNQNIIGGAERNVESTRQRLRYWDVTPEQIDQLIAGGRVRKALTFYSPFSGLVTEKAAFEGTYIEPGAIIYRVADLSKVWVYVYVYQDEIHCVYEGQPATLTLPELPGRQFHGSVVYKYPYLEPKIRAVKVRLEFENPDLVLKPDMYAQVGLEPHRMGIGLRIPRSAVLDTGRRQLVYVARPDNQFEAREITTGMKLDGEMVEILGGLKDGEQVVTSGQFLLDSESRLRSLNRKFEPPATQHRPADHGGVTRDERGQHRAEHQMSGEQHQPSRPKGE